MLKWLGKKKIAPLYVCPGDTIVLADTDRHGKKTELLRSEIGVSLTVDEVRTFTFTDEFEMEEGVGGVFGKRTT